MTGHDPHFLTGAYVVDALDEHERAEFETHLAACPDCAQEVRGLRGAVTELSRTTARVPPTDLRPEVRAAVGSTRPLPPCTGNVCARGRYRRDRWSWPAAAVACAVLAVAGTGWGIVQHREATQNAKRISAITTVLGGADAGTVTSPMSAGGSATIVYSKADKKLLLIGHGISAPPDGKAYQLWIVNAQGTAMSAGVFTPDARGHVLLQASGDLPGAAQMGISVEPAGGSSEPTLGALVAVMTM